MFHALAFKYETYGDSHKYARSVLSETALALTARPSSISSLLIMSP